MRKQSSGIAREQKVTVGEFREFVRRTGYRTDCEKHDSGWVFAKNRWEQKPDASWDNPYKQQGEHDPVVLVSWYDALWFANWKSESEGLSQSYIFGQREGQCTVESNPATGGYRLPTESEWEKMAREVLVDPSSSGAGAKGYRNQRNGNRVPPGPWYIGATQTPSLEWCWDSDGVASANSGTGSPSPASPASRICRGADVIDENGRRSDARVSCDASTAANTLSFRLIKESPVS